MIESIRERAQSFAKFMSSLPPEEIARVNKLNRKEAIEQHKQFSEAFKTGRCSFCGDGLTAFDPARPCRHWLLKPEGIRKEHIEQVATQRCGRRKPAGCDGAGPASSLQAVLHPSRQGVGGWRSDR